MVLTDSQLKYGPSRHSGLRSKFSAISVPTNRTITVLELTGSTPHFSRLEGALLSGRKTRVIATP